MTLTASVECSGTATHGEREHKMDSGILGASYDPFPQERRLEPRPRENVRKDGYTRWIGQKFEPNGCVRYFPGNTIICHLPPESALYRTLLVVYNELAGKDFALFYTLLPPASWHMTVFEGVCDQVRKPSFWPEDMSLDAPLTRCNARFKQKLASFDLGIEPPFRMAIEGWETLKDGIAVRIVSASAADELRLRQLRDRLAELLGICHPIHDTYVFHVSVAYLLRHLNQQESQDIWAFLQEHSSELPHIFELGAPEFCLFDDVFAYYRQLFLERQK